MKPWQTHTYLQQWGAYLGKGILPAWVLWRDPSGKRQRCRLHTPAPACQLDGETRDIQRWKHIFLFRCNLDLYCERKLILRYKILIKEGECVTNRRRKSNIKELIRPWGISETHVVFPSWLAPWWLSHRVYHLQAPAHLRKVRDASIPTRIHTNRRRRSQWSKTLSSFSHIIDSC